MFGWDRAKKLGLTPEQWELRWYGNSGTSISRDRFCDLFPEAALDGSLSVGDVAKELELSAGTTLNGTVIGHVSLRTALQWIGTSIGPARVASKRCADARLRDLLRVGIVKKSRRGLHYAKLADLEDAPR